MGASRFLIDNPYSGEMIAERPFATRAEAIPAIERAARAQRDWGQIGLPERLALCERFCAELERKREQVAREVTAQIGKPLSQAKGEVNTTLARARQLMALAQGALAEEPLPPLPGLARFVHHEPVGVVLAIATWNYPLLNLINVAIPALLAGNALVIKQAARAALTGETFARLFAAADAPPELVQAVHADHLTCTEMIARPEVGYVSFTGSTRGGREVAREAAKRFVEVGLGLSGKDAVYIAADANLEDAIVNVIDGAMYNAGQSCSAVERIYVHATIYDAFVEGASSEAKRLVLGDPLLAHTSMGPMAQPDAQARLAAIVEEARSKGARVLCGGNAASEEGRGRFFEPTVIADATHAMRSLMVDEVFGPLVGIAKVQGDDDAVRMINDSPYGLTAAIWTEDQARAFHLGAQLETGTVYMNRCDHLDPALPWSGTKESGRGITASRHGFHALTRRKSYNLRTQT